MPRERESKALSHALEFPNNDDVKYRKGKKSEEYKHLRAQKNKKIKKIMGIKRKMYYFFQKQKKNSEKYYN